MNPAIIRFLFRIQLAFTLLIISWLAFTPETDAVPGFFWDKGNHLCAFFVLAALVDYSFLNHSWSGWCGLAIYGIGIECGQWLLQYRNFELNDIIADVAGLTLYILSRPVIDRIRFLRKLRKGEPLNEQ